MVRECLQKELQRVFGIEISYYCLKRGTVWRLGLYGFLMLLTLALQGGSIIWNAVGNRVKPYFNDIGIFFAALFNLLWRLFGQKGLAKSRDGI